jgi:predicted enzyme related to lactoylglutathione lyase
MRGPTGANLPPTNRRARVRGNTILRFKNGKIAQSRVLFDSGDLMQQLGLMPGAAGQTSPGMPVSTARGIVHLEIPAADREVAARFYGEMFGWEYEHMGEPMNYTTFKTGNVPGGFPSLSDMYKPGDVIFYVESEDISSDLRRAERLGAKTAVPCTEIPGYGWFAILTDPTGNRVGLFSA